MFQSLDQGSIGVSKAYIVYLVDSTETVKIYFLFPVPWIHQQKFGMGVWIS